VRRRATTGCARAHLQALQALTICFAGLTLGKLLWGCLALALPKSRLKRAANAMWIINSLLQGGPGGMLAQC
jgi:hypothetical protein